MKHKFKLHSDIKTILIIIAIPMTFLIMCVLSFLLILGKDIIPIKRTQFLNYTSFNNTLYDNNAFAGSVFVDELPDSASEVKYYWERHYAWKTAAYSALLSEEDYQKQLEERPKVYRGTGNILYIYDENNVLYLEDEKLYEEYLMFLDEVLHYPEEKGKYSFVLLCNYETSVGDSYYGIVQNEENHEFIEFSTDVPKD